MAYSFIELGLLCIETQVLYTKEVLPKREDLKIKTYGDNLASSSISWSLLEAERVFVSFRMSI